MSESDKMMVISLEGMATDFHGWTEAFLLQVADRIRELNELLATYHKEQYEAGWSDGYEDGHLEGNKKGYDAGISDNDAEA